MELHALALALRAVAGHGGVRGRHRHLLRPPAGRRAPAAGRRNCPPASSRTLGPIATGLGEIFMYTVEAEARRRASPTARRGRHRPAHAAGLGDSPAAAQRAGVTEVNTIGGYARQIHITPDPAQAGRATGLHLHDVVRRGRRNNQNVGAGYIERNGQQFLVRVPGRSPTWRPSARHRARPARRRADPRARRGRGRRRPGAAHRRRHPERPRGRAGHRVHADRREQPRVSQAARRSSEEAKAACPRA
jgi:cobalt-zinc-cadmium resistance protein CzcA